ncbi:MAG TPA: ferritin-like domain-containing protein [Tepidisphaeraceae bacterium]|nr:ferritin-like domain-containing protein [Tepidisphaeraceae bacterium]
MQMESLQELLVHDLRDLYSAENQLLKAMPKMAKKATNPDLKKAFETHMRETEGQVQRLQKIFEKLGKKPTGKKCAAMEGLIEEGKEAMGEDMDEETMDAALIAVAQKIEHYEIAGYGTTRTWAQQIGDDQTARLLQQTLDEEGKTDKLLTELAESTINVEAAQA